MSPKSFKNESLVGVSILRVVNAFATTDDVDAWYNARAGLARDQMQLIETLFHFRLLCHADAAMCSRQKWLCCFFLFGSSTLSLSSVVVSQTSLAQATRAVSCWLLNVHSETRSAVGSGSCRRLMQIHLHTYVHIRVLADEN